MSNGPTRLGFTSVSRGGRMFLKNEEYRHEFDRELRRTLRLFFHDRMAWMFLVILLGCNFSPKTFDVARIYAPVGESASEAVPDPVVVVMGFMGSRLEDTGSGTVVWGEFFTGKPSIEDPRLQQLMKRAEQFARALDAPARPPPGTTLHLFAGDREEMPYRLYIDRETGEVEFNVWIPISDGCRLAARIWLPESAEHKPVPAILEYIPYRRRDHTRGRDDLAMPYIAGHGYACVRVDIRGSGDSEGVLQDEYLELEQDDGLDIMRWIAEQHWCDGSVGIIGISWGGFNGLQIAARRPPELKAVISSLCSTDDRYADDVHYMGGCMLRDNLSWAAVMLAYNSCPPDPEIVGDRWRDMWFQRLEGSGLWLEKWLRHPRRDEYWKHDASVLA